MVFPRYFFALCAVLLFAAVGGIYAEEPSESIELSSADLEILSNYIAENGEDVEERNPLLAAALRIIAQAIKWAAKHCIKEAAMHCKDHWKNPGALVDCAKNYLAANKGRCLVGGYNTKV